MGDNTLLQLVRLTNYTRDILAKSLYDDERATGSTRLEVDTPEDRDVYRDLAHKLCLREQGL